MKYYLTQEQYRQIFNKVDSETYSNRVDYFNKFNLTFYESPSVTSPGWWGILEGTEREICWFLLQL